MLRRGKVDLEGIRLGARCSEALCFPGDTAREANWESGCEGLLRIVRGCWKVVVSPGARGCYGVRGEVL
jgi:hypothetical protein